MQITIEIDEEQIRQTVKELVNLQGRDCRSRTGGGKGTFR